MKGIKTTTEIGRGGRKGNKTKDNGVFYGDPYHILVHIKTAGDSGTCLLQVPRAIFICQIYLHFWRFVGKHLSLRNNWQTTKIFFFLFECNVMLRRFE